MVFHSDNGDAGLSTPGGYTPRSKAGLLGRKYIWLLLEEKVRGSESADCGNDRDR